MACSVDQIPRRDTGRRQSVRIGQGEDINKISFDKFIRYIDKNPRQIFEMIGADYNTANIATNRLKFLEMES